MTGARRYWCHGFTFGGEAAANGPFSVAGSDVGTLLARGYTEVTQANAQARDIVVWRRGTTVIHTAVLTDIALNGQVFDADNTRFDSKNGNEFFANQSLARINLVYANTAITVYRAR